MQSRSLKLLPHKKDSLQSITRLDPAESDFFTLTEEAPSQGPEGLPLTRQDLSVSAAAGHTSVQRINEDIRQTESQQIKIEVQQQAQKPNEKLQKLGNEIILQLYVDEVIFAMDEVINLARD